MVSDCKAAESPSRVLAWKPWAWLPTVMQVEALRLQRGRGRPGELPSDWPWRSLSQMPPVQMSPRPQAVILRNGPLWNGAWSHCSSSLPGSGFREGLGILRCWSGIRGVELPGSGAVWGGKGSWWQWCEELEAADGWVPLLGSLDSGGLWVTFFLLFSARSQYPREALQK